MLTAPLVARKKELTTKDTKGTEVARRRGGYLGRHPAGVYVLVLGDLGSPQSDISGQVFRGLAIAGAIAPFVVTNDNDAAAGRSFTLVHELAHILVGSSGVSGPLRRTSRNLIERLCNDAAAYFLLSPVAFTLVV